MDDKFIETKKFIDRIEIELSTNPNIYDEVRKLFMDNVKLARNYLEAKEKKMIE